MSINTTSDLLQAIARGAAQVANVQTPTAQAQQALQRPTPPAAAARGDAKPHKLIEPPEQPPRNLPRGSYIDITV